MPKILVVDDRPSIVEVLTMLLELQGYTVVSCEDGSSALDLAITEKPDAIILDLILPGMNGLKVLEKMKSDPELNDIPVIVMTARNEKASEAASQAYACLMKPFDIQDILKLVEKALEDRVQASTAN